MRQTLSTHHNGAATRCPTRRVRVRLALASIEELDYLAELHHLSRQDVLRRLIDVGLCSDTPLQPAGPNAIYCLYVHTQLRNARSRELAITRDQT